MPHKLAHYRRYAEIATVCVRHDLGWLFDKLHLSKLLAAHGKGAQAAKPDEKLQKLGLPQRVRMCLEQLGPTFVKLGQIMSTRPDLIGRDYIEELKKLQDDVGAIPYAAVEQVLEEELGAKLDERFAHIEEKPLAAASIGQVHRAQLPDGTEVVLKVQRPGIEKTIRTDLAILFDMARLLRRATKMADMADPVLIVQEFERSILREIDFTQEGHLAEEFSHQVVKFAEVHVAAIHWKLSTRRVLTMEYLEGLKVSDTAELDEQGHDRKKIAELVVKVTLDSVFRTGLFHADPHPGNLLVLPDGKLAVIDFGMMGRFDRQTMGMLRGVALAMARRDYEALAVALLRHGVVGFDVDLRHLSRRLRELFRTMEGGRLSLAQSSELLMDFLIAERLYYQPDLILLDKTFGTLEGTLRVLCPDLEVGELFREFAPELERTLLSPSEIARTLLERLLGMDDVLIDLPSLLHRVLGRLDAGKLALRVERSVSRNAHAAAASLLIGVSLIALGLLCLGSAVVLREVHTNAQLLDFPFWPASVALAGAIAFCTGIYWLAGQRNR